MQKFLLDTSIILEILQGSAQGQKAMNIVGPSEACTSVVCKCEVLNKANLDRIEKAENFLKKLMVFGFYESDGDTAIEMQHACRKAGRHAQTLDCIIAATAYNNGATLLTVDRDFERIPQVEKIVL